ncbi:MAG: hypothetical protein D4R68_01070 [Ignavibacteriales bacterium]|nr:MAG: hypothetical protein D4R68_01070 [Ignavibacteriales bacterium]
MQVPTNEGTSASNALWDIAKIAIPSIITFTLGILFTPLRKWISSETDEYCVFTTWGDWNKGTHPIKVKKRFNKTVNINCTLYKRRTKESLNNINYLKCYYGTKPLKAPANYSSGGYCPFDTTSLKKIEKKK